MPDFWIAVDGGGGEHTILPLANAVQVDGVRRTGFRLASGLRVDWRWVKNTAQADQAAEQVYWGFDDTEDHSTEVPTGPFTIAEADPPTDPKTYLRARTWAPGPTELQKPMPQEKIIPFLETLPNHGGAAWINDWETFRASSGRFRRAIDAIERGDMPFFFETFLRFATIVLGSEPTTPQVTGAQTKWVGALEAEIGDRVFDLTTGTPPAWEAKLWLAGSHVTHNGSTWRATFGYALPTQEPGVAGAWDEV